MPRDYRIVAEAPARPSRAASRFGAPTAFSCARYRRAPRLRGMSEDDDLVTLPRKAVWNALLLLRDQATRGEDIEELRSRTIETLRKAMLESKGEG